jgi:citrate-Mg2+:H+ or citrate-Ca2+:H+ symporter, CitMHS family
LIPLQLIGMVILIGMAVILGIREKRRIAAGQSYGNVAAEVAATTDSSSSASETESQETKSEENTAHSAKQEGSAHDSNKEALARPKLLWFNILLTAAVVGTLVWGILPPAFIFMVGVCIALPVNYTNVKQQMERVRAHSPNALLMGSIILAAGVFLGILDGTGMLDAIATGLVHVLPAAWVPHLHLIIGFFGLPFELVLNTDAYYFALLPVVDQIVSGYGVASTTIAYAITIGNIIGTMISPFAPALWLGLGLARLDMGRHIKYSLLWMWAFSIVMFFVAILLGIIEI